MKKRLLSCSKKRRAALYSWIGAAVLAFLIFYSERRRNGSPEVQAQTRIIPLLSETELTLYPVLIVLLIAAGILLFIFTHRWQGGCTCQNCGKRRDRRHDLDGCN